jgi:hypothetical protein
MVGRLACESGRPVRDKEPEFMHCKGAEEPGGQESERP